MKSWNGSSNTPSLSTDFTTQFQKTEEVSMNIAIGLWRICWLFFYSPLSSCDTEEFTQFLFALSFHKIRKNLLSFSRYPTLGSADKKWQSL